MSSDNVSSTPSEYCGRLGRLRARLKPGSKILEVGGSYNPVAPRSAGFNTVTVDHGTREELLSKYDGVVENPQIEEVHYVCQNSDILHAVDPAHHGTFDVCIASHVLEHMTNPIMFIQSMEGLLNENGVLTLALPDKRGCFDFFRPLTLTGQWLEAFARSSAIHSGLSRFEFEAYTVGHNGATGWPPGELKNFVFASKGLKAGYRVLQQVGTTKSGAYEDVHAWTFVPSSLVLIIHELHALGLTSFLPSDVHSEPYWEFFVDLCKHPRPEVSDAHRLDLFKRIAQEQAVGYSQVVL